MTVMIRMIAMIIMVLDGGGDIPGAKSECDH